MNEIKKINPILRGALVAGMLILAIFAFIGLANIAPKAVSSIGAAFSGLNSSLFSPKETLVLSLSNNSVKSGDELVVSFEHKNNTTAGYYVFKFDCSNKDLSMILLDGTNQRNLSCTATSTLSSNTFKLVPQLRDANSFVDSYIHVSFYSAENSKVKASGKTVLTVQNGSVRDTRNAGVNLATTSIKTSPTNNSPATTTQKQTVYQNQYSTNPNIVRKSDLHITTKDTGIVINGVFIPKTVFGPGEVSAVRFDIGNIGNIPTGPWQFTAVLPTYPSQVFPSGIQPSLKPGEVIEYTLSLQNLAVTGNNIVSISIDPTQSVSELSETNNSAVMTLVNSGVGYSTGLVLPNNIYNYNTSNSDLMLRIISKGYLDRNNGRYYEASSVSERNRVAVRIEIENIGRGETGPFIFTANLSGYSSDQYTSPIQNTFYPGEKRQYTIDFDLNANDIGKNTVTFRLDTNNNVNEANENNNVLSQDILVH